MLFNFATKKTNPYEFTSMEKWCSEGNILDGFIGYCENGDIYMTFDTREDIPVFSNACKIGNTVSMKDFGIFKNLHLTTEKKWIEEILTTDYYILGFKKTFLFKQPTKVVSMNTFIPKTLQTA